jgi:hypothetical protein
VYGTLDSVPNIVTGILDSGVSLAGCTLRLRAGRRFYRNFAWQGGRSCRIWGPSDFRWQDEIAQTEAEHPND